MDRSRRDSTVGVGAGIAVGAGLYWFAGVASLALVAGLCWGCALKLVLHVGDRYPEFATGESWADKRWTGLSVGLVTLAALVGVSPTLPVTEALRFGLGILVVGAGLLAYTAGSLAVLERIDGGRKGTAERDHAPTADD